MAGEPMPREVGRALQAFSRAARAKHLYRSNNAALVRIMSDLNGVFGELLARTEEISLRIRPDAFVYEEERVFEEPNPEESIPFAFFRDGIRRLDFARGLTAAELDILIQATSNGFTFSGLGDDIVSYLWRHDLEHVHYVVVDTTIVDAQPGLGPLEPGGVEVDIDAQIDGLLAMIYGASTEDVGPRSVHVDGSDLAAKAIAAELEPLEESAVGFHPSRQLPKRPSYVPDLIAESEPEDEAAIQLRWLYAALEAFAVGPDSPLQDTIGQGLVDLFDMRLLSGDLAGAAQIVASMRGLEGLPDAQQRASAWVREACAETRLRPVSTAPASQTLEWQRQIGELFLACGPAAVSTLFGMIPSVQDPTARRALLDVAAEIGVEDLEPVRMLLTNDQSFVAQEAVYLLVRLGTPEARELLWSARDHPQSPVRMAVLEQADKLDPEQALDIAGSLLTDPEPKVAAAAARLLGRVQTERSVQAIEQEVRAPTLISTSLDYKIALLDAYARIHGPKALPLLAKYLAKAESRSAPVEAEDLAVASARAMRWVVTPGGVKALKTAAAYWNKRVRDEAREVLTRMKEGR